ncbi:hypothetical protein PAEPH01_1161 [Pancytospora epiphaga]|nr:hypothetical protein PAEPH01_1161 [Pancytospora epiphaga]
MLGFILNSNKSLDEKIDDLRRFSLSYDFLDLLARSDDASLKDLIYFARQVFMQYPPDKEFQLGIANDKRVFMIRLLTRLNYFNYSFISNDTKTGTELLHLIYELLTRENIFNRYLTLRMLYPLLNLPISIDFSIHLKLIGTFLSNELPKSDNDDSSICELGFFIISEVLNYLCKFQAQYQLEPVIYEGIMTTLSSRIHAYHCPRGLLSVYSENKKVMCEYTNTVVNMLKFINLFPSSPIFYECIPEVCDSLVVNCPSDCYSLRKSAVEVIVSTFSARPELFGNIEKYFMRCGFTSTRYVPLQVCILRGLSEIILLFLRGDKSSALFERDAMMHPGIPLDMTLPRDMLYKNTRSGKSRFPVISRTIFSEFDSRITEYLPNENNMVLLSACLFAYTTNVSFLGINTMSPIELKIAIVRNLRHAYRIYQLIHMEKQVTQNKLSENDLFAKEILDGVEEPSMVCLLSQLVEYISQILKIIPMLRAPSGTFEVEDLTILSKFILLPLNDYSSYNGESFTVDVSYYRGFFDIPMEDLDYIMRHCSKDILVRHYKRADLWGVLTENFIGNVALIRAANKLIHGDFINGQYKSLEFYEHMFPIAYSFFKLDKKYFKNDFTELFNVTYQCALEMGLEEECNRRRFMCYSEGEECKHVVGHNYSRHDDCLRYPLSCSSSYLSITARDVYGILNKMFLTIKAYESAYTGLYFIYNNFEKSINELFDLYTLTNNLFYIECLFNIPVSLNLLVTKYNLLIKPMEVALRGTVRMKEIVLKYIEYIIEFDNVAGVMDGLLIEIYKLLRYDDLKGMKVLSRISNVHRAGLRKNEVKITKLRDSYKITVPWELNITGREVIDGVFAEGIEDHKIRVDVSINRAVTSLIRGYHRVTFEHNFLQIRNSGILESLYVRTLNMVEATDKAREPARRYLIMYFLKVLGYSEYLRGDVDVPVEESTCGYTLNDMFSLSKTHSGGLSYYGQYYASVGDILLAFYMDDSESVRKILLGLMRAYVRYVLRSKHLTSSGYRVFVNVLLDGFVYAVRRSKEMVLLFYNLLDEEYALIEKSSLCNSIKLHEIKNKFVSERIVEIVGLVYVDDDLKSVHALLAIKFYIETAAFYVDENICPVVMYAVRHKLLRSKTYRIYELCLKVMVTLFDKFELKARSYYESVFNIVTAGLFNIVNSPSVTRVTELNINYFKLFHCEMEHLYGLNPMFDLPVELDRRSALRILKIPKAILEKHHNLVALTENILKSIDKTDYYFIMVYSSFLGAMMQRNSRFGDILSPTKKYLPSVAVVEGFGTSEIKQKFVETVNRNGHLQSSNPNSFRVFRNLFYNFKVSQSIKSNFIECYNSQIYNNDTKYVSIEYRIVLYDILLNSREYDLVTVDFLLTKICDVTAGQNFHRILSVISERLGISQNAVMNGSGCSSSIIPQAEIARYLIEHIHQYYVYQLILYYVSPCFISSYFLKWLAEYYYAAAAASLPSFSDRVLQSKRAYRMLTYLQANDYKFENFRLVLLVYRDLYCDYPSVISLVNYCFGDLSPEEVDLLYRINPSAVITSPRLLEKMSVMDSEYIRSWLLHSLESRVMTTSNSWINFFIPVRFLGSQSIFRPILNNPGCGDDDDGMDSLYVDDSCSISDVSESLSYEPSLSDVSIGDSIEVVCSSSMSSMGDDRSFMGNDRKSTEGIDKTLIESNNNIGIDKTPIENNNIIGIDKTPIEDININPINIIDSREYTFIINSLSRIDGLPFLPLIEFFINAHCKSEQMISFCKTFLGDTSVRFAALYYLCMFDPSPDYATVIFKLNFHERIYAVDCLLLLVDRFGVDTFIPIITTVIRSEMRFMTTREILLSLIILRPELADNESLYIELCVLSYRLFSRSIVNYKLYELILRKYKRNRKEGDIITELTTQVIFYEFSIASFRIFYTSDNFDFDRVLWRLEGYCKVKNDSKNEMRIKAMFIYVDKHMTGDNKKATRMDGYRKEILEIFISNPMVTLTKRMIIWLYGDLSSYLGKMGGVGLEVFLSSTAENKINLLELLMMSDVFVSFVPFSFELFKELVKQGWKGYSRLLVVFRRLLEYISDQIAGWMLLEVSVLDYPMFAEYIADLIPKIDSMTAISLCLLKFNLYDNRYNGYSCHNGYKGCNDNGHNGSNGYNGCNGHNGSNGHNGHNDHNGYNSYNDNGYNDNIIINDNVMEKIYLTNFLHLFKQYSPTLPFSIEFYKGCLSDDKIIRDSYISLFYSQMPTDAYSTVEYILKCDWKGASSSVAEYLIAVSFLRVLKFIGHDKLSDGYNGYNDNHNKIDNNNHNNNHNTTLINDGLVDMFYNCADSASFITDFLLVLFKLLSNNSLQRLYPLYVSSNMPFRIKECFIQAFDSRNISCDDIHFNPYNPTLRFYFNMGDISMYCGMIKAMSGLRETKAIAKLLLMGRHEQALSRIYEVFGGVERREISYKKQDMRILESIIKYIYDEHEMDLWNDGFKGVSITGSNNKGKGGVVKRVMRTDESIGSMSPIFESSMISSPYTGQLGDSNSNLNNSNGCNVNNSNGYNYNNIISSFIPSSNHLDIINVVSFDNSHPFYSTFTEDTTIDKITSKFTLLINRIVNSNDILPLRDEIEGVVNSLKDSLHVMCYIPRTSRIFSRLLMYAAICSEIEESLLILRDGHNDSIYGRFRMWMVRHPSYMADLVDWSLFMKWRMFIFNSALGCVSENDKKKISSEICKLSYLYGSKLFKEKMYQRTSYVLNSINSMSTIELQQNVQKYMLDIESLFSDGEYGTMISLINSININRLSNEDRSRLYHWASKAFLRLQKKGESERFSNLSKKMGEIIENKKEYIRILREELKNECNKCDDDRCDKGNDRFDNRCNDNNDINNIGNNNNDINNIGNNNNDINNIDININNNNIENIKNTNLKSTYTSKLIELINELPISDSHLYLIYYIENRDYSEIENIQPDKLYFFMPQLRNNIEHLLNNNLVRTSFNSMAIFEKIYKRHCEKWKEYYNLKDRFKEYINASNNSTEAINTINRLFDMEIRYKFEINTLPLILHTFNHITAAPGQFSSLRNEYRNIKTMCYIEDFYSAQNEAEGIFFVRNIDGSVTKVLLYNPTNPSDNPDYVSSVSPSSQLLELLNHCLKSHDLEKAGFDIFCPSNTGIAIAHDRAYFTADSLIKLQLFRKQLSFCEMVLESIKIDKEKKAGFSRAALKWQDLLKREIVERLVASRDFYMFRNKFVNSYSSLIALQYLLGTCNISLERTFIEENSGNVFLVDPRNCKKHNNTPAEQFYIRPNIGCLFADEGKNGPLILILSRFAEAYLSGSSNSAILKFFLGQDKEAECLKRISKLVFNGVDDGGASAEIIVGEMTDHKTGLSKKLSEMCWV